MKRAAILALTLGSAACTPEREEAPPPSPAEGALSDPHDDQTTLPIGAQAPVSIVGEWRVAGVNHTEIDQPYAMTATISDTLIQVRSQCLTFVRAYTLEGVALGVGPKPGPMVMCDRGHDPQERQVDSALAAADTAYRMPDGSLVLAGPGGRITLFTQ